MEAFSQWPKDLQEAAVVLAVAVTWRRWLLNRLELAASAKSSSARSPSADPDPKGDHGDQGRGGEGDSTPSTRRSRRRRGGGVRSEVGATGSSVGATALARAARVAHDVRRYARVASAVCVAALSIWRQLADNAARASLSSALLVPDSSCSAQSLVCVGVWSGGSCHSRWRARCLTYLFSTCNFVHLHCSLQFVKGSLLEFRGWRLPFVVSRRQAFRCKRIVAELHVPPCSPIVLVGDRPCSMSAPAVAHRIIRTSCVGVLMAVIRRPTCLPIAHLGRSL